jgi:chromosome segregation ATPase
MSAPDPAIYSLCVGVIAALGAYLAATRRLSGKIGTSDAAELWRESASIRDDYRERLAVAERRVLSLEERVAMLERDNNALTRENGALASSVSSHEATVAFLRARLTMLDTENATLREVKRPDRSA